MRPSGVHQFVMVRPVHTVKYGDSILTQSVALSSCSLLSGGGGASAMVIERLN